MRQETFISYHGYRWLILTVLAVVMCSAVYLIDDPIGGRNGGTIVGYTFGTLATIGVVWLMSYGVRKRAYYSSLGSVQGWLSAHVWIGTGLLVLVPLHAGFSFGWNVHTLTFLLMVVTIVSGIWGVFNYATLASRIESHRGGGKSTQILEHLQTLSSDVKALCKDKSEAFVSVAQRLNPPFTVNLMMLLRKAPIAHIDQRVAGAALATLPDSEHDEALRLFGILDQRCDLINGLLEEARVKALLRIWLFIHVPASVALCVALAIHILSVFFFW
ncbi:MAG: hypothetical protein RL518_1992 [Pseudomonadota bacterium]